LSAAEFARRPGLNYRTFCGWRSRRDLAKALPSFVQVEVAPPVAPVELVIEVGRQARMRRQCESQIALAVKLLERLNARRPG